MTTTEMNLGSAFALKKINLFLRAMGEAPILKKQKFKLDGTKTILEVEKFLKKSLNVNDKAIYMYCGSGFSPMLDQQLQSLYENFQVSGELVILYGINELYG